MTDLFATLLVSRPDFYHGSWDLPTFNGFTLYEGI